MHGSYDTVFNPLVTSLQSPITVTL
uniref:Uncharacterized protein n=1 Tax=Arundo donax TaxID=35708 RepID=A0A0A9BIB0_ARUDO